MDSASFWIVYIITGAIGAAYFIYGQRQKAIIPLVTGIGLCVYPYFISNIFLLIGIGIALIILPFLIKY